MEENNQNEEPVNSREQDETPQPYMQRQPEQAQGSSQESSYKETSDGKQEEPGQEESTSPQQDPDPQRDASHPSSQYQQYSTGTNPQDDASQQETQSQQYSTGANSQNDFGQQGNQYEQYSGLNQQGSANQQSNYYQQNGSANQQSSQYQQYGQYQQYRSNTQYDYYQKADQGASSTGFGIASMILGILSLVLFCTCLNIPMAIAAVIFGILQICRGQQARGMAIAGIVTAVLSVIALLVMIALMWTPFMEYYREEAPKVRPGYDYEYDYDDGMEDFFDFFDGRNQF